MKIKILCVVAAVLLLLAIPDKLWPYWYYNLLRLIVTIISIIIVWKSYEHDKGQENLEKKLETINTFSEELKKQASEKGLHGSRLERKVENWFWSFIVVAFLFNPLWPIYLTKEIWVIIDFIVAGIFLFAAKDKILGNITLGEK